MTGSLASVDILTFKSGSITISWSAPFSLDVTDVDPDIWYSVLIYNVTDNPTAIPCTDCINITETHYTFTPDYPSPCHKYIFTVIPFNGAGQGHSSGNITGYTAQMSKIQNQCHMSNLFVCFMYYPMQHLLLTSLLVVVSSLNMMGKTI